MDEKNILFLQGIWTPFYVINDKWLLILSIWIDRTISLDPIPFVKRLICCEFSKNYFMLDWDNFWFWWDDERLDKIDIHSSSQFSSIIRVSGSTLLLPFPELKAPRNSPCSPLIKHIIEKPLSADILDVITYKNRSHFFFSFAWVSCSTCATHYVLSVCR